ncbi:MAG: ATP synthase F1 subunit gamma [Oscillospiraceae bacterium]|jgi:F-type H+-transporting ATPase subunit gamma|nr:ATP synthase F1 subunit gamma [Oscillospiraceae bacterium]
MPGAAELKGRISSIRDTRKITNAMELISSAKLRRAKANLDQTRPYFSSLQAEITRIFRLAPNAESRYFSHDEAEQRSQGAAAGRNGCVVVTADKGLAGSYNHNVLRAADAFLARTPDTELFVVGEYGRRYFTRRGVPIDGGFLFTGQSPTMHRARLIAAGLLDRFDSGELKTIYMIYTDFKNGVSWESVTTRLLPFHHSHFEAAMGPMERVPVFDFVPSVTEVLDAAARNYMVGFIYSALTDSFCSEQNARMTAMDAAGRNADKMLDTLGKQYQRSRQEEITRELTEISAGAKALRARESNP